MFWCIFKHSFCVFQSLPKFLLFFSKPAVNSFGNLFKVRHIFKILFDINSNTTFIAFINRFIGRRHLIFKRVGKKRINLSVDSNFSFFFFSSFLFIYRCSWIVSVFITLQKLFMRCWFWILIWILSLWFLREIGFFKWLVRGSLYLFRGFHFYKWLFNNTKRLSYCFYGRFFKNWIEFWLSNHFKWSLINMLNWSSFCRFNWRRFNKCCNFSNCLEPTLQFKKIIYASNVIMSCSFHMIIHFVLVKFLHIFNLLFQTINFMTF